MSVLQERETRGAHDEPGPVPSGHALLELGTDNQTRLVGAPVSGRPRMESQCPRGTQDIANGETMYVYTRLPSPGWVLKSVIRQE